MHDCCFGRSWIVPRASPGIWTSIVLPVTNRSGSAVPNASIRFRMFSSAWFITVSGVPSGADRITDTPPSRSRPRTGRVPVTNRAIAPRARSPTSTSETQNDRCFFFIGVLPPRSCELGAVDQEFEPAVQHLGREAAQLHASEEDLEVLHDLADLRVDDQLEAHGLRRGVYPQERLLGGEVHAVVDVEFDLAGLADPAAVHVGLVRQDHRGRDRRGGVPV